MENKIGALWIKKDKNGKTYFSGQIEIDGVKIPITIFTNKKAKDTHPDYTIYPVVRKEKQVEDDDGDIPF
jgi:uncharacterized protein (DUF736 family)